MPFNFPGQLEFRKSFPEFLVNTVIVYFRKFSLRVPLLVRRFIRGSGNLGSFFFVPRPLGPIRFLSFRGRMDEAASATKALGLDEPPIGGSVEGVGSDTESEAEVAPMSVIAEPRNIDMRAEHLPNSDEAEAAFAGRKRQEAMAVQEG